jgi:pantoate--beta-alanine ligase
MKCVLAFGPTTSTPSTDRFQPSKRVHVDLITSPDVLQTFVLDQRRHGNTVGLVPTMGALHRGHLSLIDIARRHADIVIVSTFVNPLQFENRRDFDLYPLTQSADEEMCQANGVHVLYRPTPEVMYPSGFSTTVHVAGLSDILEGASRPGHFDGVATVVTKLLTAADPDIAVFGAKDFQQVAVIRRMVSDLGFRVRIIVAPTVREDDGLAMSSRNVRLDSEARSAARGLHRGLHAACEAFATGTTDAAILRNVVIAKVSSSPLVNVDYVHIVDPYSLDIVSEAGPDDVVLIAAVVGGVRLIDNVVLGSNDAPGS